MKEVATNRAIELAKIYYPLKFIFSCIIAFLLLQNINFALTLNEFDIVLIILAIIFFGISLLDFVRVIINFLRIRRYNKSININYHVMVRCGEPGSGKSSSTLYDAVLLAKKMWIELQFKYWLDIGNENEIYTTGDKQKITDWERVKKSYLFYKNTDCFPCLFSNIGLRVEGQFTNVCTREHIEQKINAPEHTVFFYDEIGSVVSIDETKNSRPVTVAECLRWCRHFGEFYFLMTEQDKMNVNKDIRRVVSENKYFYSQTHILKPIFLNWYYEFRKKRLVKKMDIDKSKKIAKNMKFLKLFLDACGYRKYRYKSFGSTEGTGSEVRGKGTFILPSLLNAEYDSRCFRFMYKAINKPFIANPWKNLSVIDEFNKSVIDEFDKNKNDGVPS